MTGLRRAVIALAAVAALLFATTTPASAHAVMGWPELHPAGYGRCVVGLEVGDYYGHPYAITRDLGYGVGSGWCEGTDPYLGNNYRFRVTLTFWLPGCGYTFNCMVTYTSGWVTGYQYQGTDTYIHVGGNYVAEPEKACLTAQRWAYGVGWVYDYGPNDCVYY